MIRQSLPPRDAQRLVRDLGPRPALAPIYISQKISCSLEMQFLAKSRAARNAKYYMSNARARFILLVHRNRKSHNIYDNRMHFPYELGSISNIGLYFIRGHFEYQILL